MAPAVNVLPFIRAKIGREDATIFRQGQYGFSELVAWQQLISQNVRLPGLSSIDADESRNRVRITLVPGASSDDYVKSIAALGVPDSAVMFDTRSRATDLSSLWDRARPTMGGYQISIGPTEACTLGFNVDVTFYGMKGFLTAAHCALGTEGNGQTGDSVYQNLSYSSSNLIGRVTLNPAWNSTDSGCGGISLCTDADVMFVLSSNSSSSEWSKRIVVTTDWDSNDGNNHYGGVTVAGYWSGISIAPFIVMNQIAYKAGRTTGITSGTITETCSNPSIGGSGGTHVVLCEDGVDGAGVGAGDSGGPVFYPSDTFGNPPYALGIENAGSWGTSSPDSGGNARCTSSCFFWFAEWSAVQTHLTRYFSP